MDAQLTLFDVPVSTTLKQNQVTQVVNVASVPQRSPFRYPGGKTWAIPIIKKWLKQTGTPVPLLVEPFAGGRHREPHRYC
jgi:DNA adenine methylase